MTFEQRFAKVKELILALHPRQGRMIAQAARDLQFAAKDTAHDLNLTMERLETFLELQDSLATRRPLGGPGS